MENLVPDLFYLICDFVRITDLVILSRINKRYHHLIISKYQNSRFKIIKSPCFWELVIKFEDEDDVISLDTFPIVDFLDSLNEFTLRFDEDRYNSLEQKSSSYDHYKSDGIQLSSGGGEFTANFSVISKIRGREIELLWMLKLAYRFNLTNINHWNKCADINTFLSRQNEIDDDFKFWDENGKFDS